MKNTIVFYHNANVQPLRKSTVPCTVICQDVCIVIIQSSHRKEWEWLCPWTLLWSCDSPLFSVWSRRHVWRGTHLSRWRHQCQYIRRQFLFPMSFAKIHLTSMETSSETPLKSVNLRARVLDRKLVSHVWQNPYIQKIWLSTVWSNLKYNIVSHSFFIGQSEVYT